MLLDYDSHVVMEWRCCYMGRYRQTAGMASEGGTEKPEGRDLNFKSRPSGLEYR